MQSTKANTKTPAISSARVPGARKAAAVSSPSSSKLATSTVAPPEFEEAATKVSPPEPKPLAGWGLQDFDEEEEEEAGAVAKSAAAKKGGKSAIKGKGRAPSKDKYLLSRPTPPAAAQETDLEGEDPFMSGDPAAAGFGDVPSSFDPFADAARAEDAAAPRDVVHLRVQQRNGRKSLTTVQGLCADFNYAKILRDLKRELCCSGVVVEDEELGKIIQLQGDHRRSVGAFIVKNGMARKDNVKIHGI
ncbi:hypothetical protein EJB05_39735, partial [Eragrostis curvula]